MPEAINNNVVATKEIGQLETHSWENKWKAMLSHLLGMHNAFEQVMYIMTSVFPAMEGYSTHVIGNEAKLMNKLSKILNGISSIQSAFNAASNSKTAPLAAKILDLMKEANTILTEVYTDPAFKNNKSLQSNILAQITTIFKPINGPTQFQNGVKPPQLTVKNGIGICLAAGIGEQWEKVWKDANTPPSNPGATTSTTNTNIIGPYDNAFSNMSTAFNSQNSVVQAELKQVESNLTEYYGIEQNIMSDYASLEKQSNSAVNQA